MKILVTGGNGQLGRSIKKVAPEYAGLDIDYMDLPEADITDKTGIGGLILKGGYDVLVNCAAFTAVDKAEEVSLSDLYVNSGALRGLSEMASASGCKIIHISTDYVFDGSASSPLKETDPVGPQTAYGRSKLEGERMLEQADGDAIVIRTSWLYSEFGENFVKKILSLAGQYDCLNVVYDQVGTPTYAPDLARVILTLAQKGFTGYELYHYSNEGVASWYDFARAIVDLYGIEKPVKAVGSEMFPMPAKRPSYSVLSKEKIKANDIEVPYWRDSLAVCIEELKKQ